MKAMILERPGAPLKRVETDIPVPGAGQVLVKVAACGVCRTDLHVVDGELDKPKLPIVPGHEIVGNVAALGSGVQTLKLGDRVGIPGSAEPVIRAASAGADERTCAMKRASRAIRSTAAMRTMRSPRRSTVSH